MQSIQLSANLINVENGVQAELSKETLSNLNVLQQIVVKKCLNLAVQVLNNNIEVGGLEPFVKWIDGELTVLARGLIENAIALLDEKIFISQVRKNEWLSRKIESRSLITKFGKISFERRYYLNLHTKKSVHLVDEYIGMEKRSRIEKGLIVDIAENVKDHSYQKSSQLACCPNESYISKSTVMKLIRQIEPLELPPPEQKDVRKNVKKLYIHADEDHIAMQNGKSSIVKSATIHENRVRICKNKTLLLKKKVFASYTKSPELFWQDIFDDTIERYGYREDLIISICGDGANWIKTGLKELPNSHFVIDKFHLKKEIKKVLPDKTKFPYMHWLTECKIWQYFRHNNFESLKVFIGTLAAEDYVDEEVAQKTCKYLCNNSEGIINLIETKNPNVRKSCTEAQISHVLSERLSSRPKGWSSKGVEAVVNIRTHLLNGGHITSDNFKKKPLPMDEHNVAILKLRKKLAPEINLFNFNIVQSMPKARDNTWIRNIAHSNHSW